MGGVPGPGGVRWKVARPPANRDVGGRVLMWVAPPSLGWPSFGAYSSAVEHLPYKQVVAGSIPAAPTCFKGSEP